MNQWKNKKVSTRVATTKKRKYLTKKIKLQRACWGIIVGLTVLASIIMYQYPQYVFEKISATMPYTEVKVEKQVSIKSDIKTEESEVKDLSIEQQILNIAKEHNFKWPEYLVKLAKCESKLNPLAVNDKNNNPSWSKDRGLFQYNSHWQSKVSDECSFDVRCSTEKTMELINAGKQHLWVCNDLVLAMK